MFRLSVENTISAAHRLEGYDGPCSTLHGHNWRIVAEVESDQLDKIGMVIDFDKLSKILQEVVDVYDHRMLNEIAPFDKLNPTAEHISRHIYQEMNRRLPGHVKMSKIAVWETEKCLIEYYE